MVSAREDPFEPLFAHTSHVLEKRLLFCLFPRSQRRTSFGRRWVQAQVSLCEVTPDKAARRQRSQAPWAAS